MHLFDSITFETNTSTSLTSKQTNKSGTSSSSQPSSNSSISANLVDLGKKLLDASKNGNTEHVKSLTQSGAPFTTDYLGTSPLHFAAQNGHTDSAEILLKAGVSKDARTKLDRTALHVAAQEGHLSMVELLLSHGADANARDMLKMTPLHWAVERGHISIVDRLLNSGADVTAISKFFITPVEIAEELENYEILDLLRRFISCLNVNNLDRATPIRSNHINSTESRSYSESTNTSQRKRNRGTKANTSYTKPPNNNCPPSKAIVADTSLTTSTSFYSQMLRPLIESNTDIMNLGSGFRFDGNKRRLLIANISSSNPANISDMSSSMVDKKTAEWLKSALITSAPDSSVTQNFYTPSGGANSDIDSGNFNASDDFNPLDMIGDGVDDIDFDEDDEHPILRAYHNFDYSDNCLNGQSDVEAACAHNKEAASSETSILDETKLGRENPLDNCIDLVDLDRHPIKMDPELFLPTTDHCQKDVDVKCEDFSQEVERYKKKVERLERENLHLRQRIREQELAASGSRLINMEIGYKDSISSKVISEGYN